MDEPAGSSTGIEAAGRSTPGGLAVRRTPATPRPVAPRLLWGHPPSDRVGARIWRVLRQQYTWSSSDDARPGGVIFTPACVSGRWTSSFHFLAARGARDPARTCRARSSIDACRGRGATRNARTTPGSTRWHPRPLSAVAARRLDAQRLQRVHRRVPIHCAADDGRGFWARPSASKLSLVR